MSQNNNSLLDCLIKWLADLSVLLVSVATPFQTNEELTITLEEKKFTGFSCGPTAGQYIGSNRLLAAVEVSDQNLPKMAEHVVC
jgi:hypothetical protein